mgnify:CR=1 FL=1
MASIDELKQLVDKWQKVEDNGGSPTSGAKLKVYKRQLAEAEEAAKPVKKAKKAKKEEPVVDDWNEDDAIAEADEEE